MRIAADDIRVGDTVSGVSLLAPLPHTTVTEIHKDTIQLPNGPTTMVYVTGTRGIGMFPLFGTDTVWRSETGNRK